MWVWLIAKDIKIKPAMLDVAAFTKIIICYVKQILLF